MASNTKRKTLSLNDLGVVLNELYPVREKWFNIGVQLLVSVIDLQRIESEYKNDHSTCLRQMLIKWLEVGSATWEALCNALRCPIVMGAGDNNDLVTNLQKKYCTEPTKTKKRKNLGTEIEPPSTKKPKGDLPDTLDPDNFVNSPAEDRLCIKCRLVPTNPQLSSCCNTVYCQPCSKSRTYCVTHHGLMSYTDDKKLKNKIMDLRSKCPNWRGGCQFKDAVSKVYKQHLPECQVQASPMPVIGIKSRDSKSPPVRGVTFGETHKKTYFGEPPKPESSGEGNSKLSSLKESKEQFPGGSKVKVEPSPRGGINFGEPTFKYFGSPPYKPAIKSTLVQCKYQRIGCRKMFASQVQLQQHLLEEVQHHLDLAIGKIEELLEANSLL